MQDGFYAVAFRNKLYMSLDELQTDVDAWTEQYNRECTPIGKYCFGRTPWQTFHKTKHLAQARMLDTLIQPEQEKSSVPNNTIHLDIRR